MEVPADVRLIPDRTPMLRLTTGGRRTGQPRTAELSFAHRDGRPHLLAFEWSQGVRNLQAHTEAEARAGPLKLQVEAVLPEDKEAAINSTREMFVAKYGKPYVARWYRGTDWRAVVLRVERWTNG